MGVYLTHKRYKRLGVDSFKPPLFPLFNHEYDKYDKSDTGDQGHVGNAMFTSSERSRYGVSSVALGEEVSQRLGKSVFCKLWLMVTVR